MRGFPFEKEALVGIENSCAEAKIDAFGVDSLAGALNCNDCGIEIGALNGPEVRVGDFGRSGECLGAV